MDTPTRRSYTSAITTKSEGALHLWHGTDADSAIWIVEKGLDEQKLLEIPGAYAFFATTDQKIACLYARMNPRQGPPALVEFDIAGQNMQFLLEQGPPPWVVELVEDKGYEFSLKCFPVMNQIMTNRSVQEVTELNWTV